ncbi:MAG: LamG-like jellyroll fold domain-containing protein [Sedimentisphaeraceae bacterium JB056]
MIRSCVLFFIVFCSLAIASDCRIDYNSSTGNVSIWIEAENYDSKTDQFTVDTEAWNTSGSALYFSEYSNKTQIDQWWAEYSIDSADLPDPAIELSGNWYCWVRVNQPAADDEEANYLVVKNDSGDGSGESWYSTAIAGVTDEDDILGNDLPGNDGAGAGKWIWLGADSTTSGVEKEFSLDTDGKIVFRINEREAGENSERIDAIFWTNEPNYVPTDLLFGEVVISNGLAFEANAADAGDLVNDYWTPVLGSGDGLLEGKPVLTAETADATAGTYNWFYEFTDRGAGNTKDQATGLETHDNLSFVDDDWCTIEAWIRMPAAIANSKGRGMIVGNCDGADTGWRLETRCDAATGKYAIAFLQRDNETAATSTTGAFYYHSGYILDYSATDWVHVVFVKYAAQYNSTTGKIEINHDIYVNGGTRVTHGVQSVTASSIDDFYFKTDDIRFGTYRDDIYYVGDIAAVRIYNRLLTQAEVQANYDAGIDSMTSWQCGGQDYDVTGDCVVNLDDMAAFAAYWLADSIVSPE